MNKSIWFYAASVVVLGASLVVVADETPSTQPAKHAGKTAAVKVESPYNKVSGLTEAQNVKLADIHKKALADLKEIREKEEADSRGVLTDEQKTELDKILAERKEEAADKNKMRQKAKATTSPAT